MNKYDAMVICAVLLYLAAIMIMAMIVDGATLSTRN